MIDTESLPPKPKSRRRMILTALACVAAIVGGYLWYTRHGREATDDAQIDADIVLVPARVGGFVTKVNFTDNQRVKAGDVLAELDSAALAARLAQADASLAQAIAAADAAEASATLAERNAVGNQSAARANLSVATIAEKTSAQQLAEGQAQLVSAQAQLTQAKQDADRDRKLAASGAITRAQAEQTDTKLQIAQSNLDVAKARIATLRSSVNAAHSKIDEASARASQNNDIPTLVRQARAQADAAKAQVKIATAVRDLAALDLSFAKIIAPQDGVISKKAINVGQQLVTGQAVGQLITDARWVTANYKETQVARMKVGQPVKITVDAFDDVTLRGTVESISSGTGSRFALLPPDNASGNFTKVVQRVPVRIRLLAIPAGITLRTGMNVEAIVDVR